MSGAILDEARARHVKRATANFGDTCPASEVDGSQASPSGPKPASLVTRLRVKRACDECRRQRIKCDGNFPCTHCIGYTYECAYAQHSNRREQTPKRIEALANRLQQTEAFLNTVLPAFEMCGPDLGATIQQRIQKWYPAKATNAISLTPSLSPAQTPHAGQDAQLQSMIESTGQLDIDKGGYYNFRGVSSEKVFARVMDEQFKDLLGAGQIISSFHGTSSALDYDLLRSGTGPSPDFSYHNVTCLPSREVAKVLCYNALNRACSLLRFVHQTTFYETLDRIYKALAKGLSSEENRHLPLIYTVLALGCLFYSDPINGAIPIEHSTYERRVDQGAKYFRAARRMIDITDCRDIASLQAVVFMALFLHWSADLGACYSYIGIALRSALRMGLHRELCLDINPIERETRKRVFWAIRNMDVYVSAMLGLPVMLSTDEIDQPLPMEVDDECITEDAVISMPVGKTSLQVAANAHTRLVLILADVIKHVYPMNALQPDYGSTKSSYSISHTKIRGIERDLADWLDKLPLYLRPSGEGTPEVFCHVQMMLYRPFLHYVSERSCAGENIDNRSYAYAAACISVSRNIIHITTEMKRRDLLFGWISTCTTFFSIISLVYFVLENPDEDESQKILANANDGKDALTGFGRESMTADRCSTALNAFFEKLPEKLKASIEDRISAPPPHSGGAPTPHRSLGSARQILGTTRLVYGTTTKPELTPLEVTGSASSLHENWHRGNSTPISIPRESFLEPVPSVEPITSFSDGALIIPDQNQDNMSNQFNFDNSRPYLSPTPPHVIQRQEEFDWGTHQVGYGIMPDFNQQVSISYSGMGQTIEMNEMLSGEGGDWDGVVPSQTSWQGHVL